MMRVSTRLDYGIKAMVRLASAYDRGPVPLSWVAREERVSLAYLEQLMIPLKTRGLVKSTRGAKGGYRLARLPRIVTVAEVAEALEGPFVPIFCLEPFHASKEVCCTFEPSCSTRDIWARVRDQVNSTLRGVSLEDLCRQEAKGLESPPEKEPALAVAGSS